MSFSIAKYHFITGSILEGLPKEDFRILRGSMQRMEYKKGKVLYTEGSYSKGVYVVRKGKIKIYQVNKDGKEQIAYIYGKGEIMGYRPLLCNERHPVSACALEDTVVSFIPKTVFLEVIDTAPALAHHLLVNLSHEFSVWINKITVFAQQPVRSRVALSLLILNEKYRNPRSRAKYVSINLSREDLANYSGTTIESLVRMLRSLKDEHIIQAKGRKIIILQPQNLEVIAESY
jgi:CRP-like cAMP-binding protein